MTFRIVDVDWDGNSPAALSIVDDGSDNPSGDVFAVKSMNHSKRYVPYNATGHPVDDGLRYYSEEFQLQVKTSVDSSTVQDPASERTYMMYLDYENLNRADPTSSWKSSFIEDDRAFPLPLRVGEDASSSNYTLYYQLRNVEESPVFWFPSAGSTPGTDDGTVTDSVGMAATRTEYLVPINASFSPGINGSLVSTETGRLAASIGEYDQNPDPNRTEIVRHAKIDFIYGKYFEFSISPSSLAYDPEGDAVRI